MFLPVCAPTLPGVLLGYRDRISRYIWHFVADSRYERASIQPSAYAMRSGATLFTTASGSPITRIQTIALQPFSDYHGPGGVILMKSRVVGHSESGHRKV